MRDILYEPLKYYESEGKAKHKQNVEEYFDELVKRSGVNIEENGKTVGKYNEKLSVIDKLSKKCFWLKFLRVVLIIAAVLGGFAAIYGIVYADMLIILAGAVAVAGSLLLIFLCINKKIKKLNEQLNVEKSEAQKLLDEACAQMEPLNSLFKKRDTFDLIEKTLPEISFDNAFFSERERELIELYDYEPDCDDDKSVIDALSGRFSDKPFLYERYLVKEMRDEIYHGYRTITYRQTYHDSKGNLRTRTVTQTLHASVVKPKPYYYEDTFLNFGAQGAPDLSFTREGMHHEDKSERQINRLIKKGERKLKKRSEEALAKGENFTEMANTEFDVLFGAHDRNHEVQFRMLFTPLAQNNMVDLMRSEVGYGDDFDFYKFERRNVIHSDHAQKWKMDTDISNYHSYDFEEIKRKFNDYNNEYFKSVFFDFAPILALPIYHDKVVKSLEKPKEYTLKFTMQEYECLVNRMPSDLLAPVGAKTKTVYNAIGMFTKGERDRVRIKACSHDTIDRIDTVMVLGGDGRMHAVPVPWTEYIPIVRESEIDVMLDTPENREATSDAVACCHGLLATVPAYSKI